jgi:hypothetical protein
MDERWLSILIALGVCIILATAYVWYQHRTRGKREAEQASERAELEKLVKAGLRTADGHNACMVCGVTATEYMPISGSSWMDKLPLLNRLFSLPPRYVIEDNLGGDLCLCKIHKAVAVRRLEEFHAGLRAERAQFNAGHEERVAAMDGGELMRSVMQQHSYQLKVLRRDTSTPLPQLEGPRIDSEQDIAVISGGGPSIPPEDEEND